MYSPPLFREIDEQVLINHIVEHPLGLVFSAGRSGPMVSALPFLHIRLDGRSRLVTHLARANPHSVDLSGVGTCLVVFLGANSYITPDWYVTTQESGRVVPTWNYEVVQVTGEPTIHDDRDWLLEHLSGLTDAFERKRSSPWRITDAPKDYVDARSRAIVGLEIAVERVEGKWKMSQNRVEDDVVGVVAGLSDLADPHADPAVAMEVAARLAARRHARTDAPGGEA